MGRGDFVLYKNTERNFEVSITCVKHIPTTDGAPYLKKFGKPIRLKHFGCHMKPGVFSARKHLREHTLALRVCELSTYINPIQTGLLWIFSDRGWGIPPPP